MDTSDGPDLHLWLTDAPVVEGRAGRFVFDDGTVVVQRIDAEQTAGGKAGAAEIEVDETP